MINGSEKCNTFILLQNDKTIPPLQRIVSARQINKLQTNKIN